MKEDLNAWIFESLQPSVPTRSPCSEAPKPQALLTCSDFESLALKYEHTTAERGLHRT